MYMHTYTHTHSKRALQQAKAQAGDDDLGGRGQGRGELVSGVVSARGTKPGSGSDRVSPIRRTVRNPVWADELDRFGRNG